MDILSKIKPSRDEQLQIERITEEFVQKLKKIKDVKFIIGGSISKDTWLKGTNEVDIFAKFNYLKFKSKSDEISEVLFKELKKLFSVNRVHGSRDYFHIKFKYVIFEIVPILDVKKPEQALNVTDLSPLHIDFVKKYSKLKDDIRLMKSFCKANSLYGAESYISGFSGYALEVLVIYYNSFNNVLKNSTKWKQKVIIDFYKKLKNPLLELNSSKINSPLILIDPVDSTRNICASLSSNNFNKFIQLSKNYLKKPSEKFFIHSNVVPSNAIVLKIKTLEGKKDIIGDKIVKVFNFIKNELIKNGFEIKKSSWTWENDVEIWFTLKSNKLEPFYLHKGPPKKLINNIKEFKKKYNKVFIKNGFYYTKIKRKFTDINDYLKLILKNNYVKERVNSIEIWK